MVNRLISVIPAFPADNQGHICVTKPGKLVCFFDQSGLPSAKLLRLCFGCVWHVAKALLYVGWGEEG